MQQTGTRILIAAQKPPLHQDLEAAIVQMGYQLVAADDCEAAYLIHAQNQVDAIVAVASPDAINLFERLRREKTHTTLILIATTEFNAVANAVADVVIPPVPERLAFILALLFENQQLQTKNTQLAEQVAEQQRIDLENQQLRTDKEQLAAQVKDQQRVVNETEILKNAIVRNVSHELRTPLLQVKAAVSLIKESDDSDIGKLVYYAESAVAKLEMLIKNITTLGLSLDIHLAPIIVRDAVAYARRDLRRVWQQRDNADRVELQIEPNLPPIRADKQGLGMVLQLLIDNALKFSQTQQTPVEVIARKDGEHIWIGVRDYGIGIAPDKLKKIFDTFYQVDSSSTRQYGGTGVGLALVQLILGRHDAEIHVESEPDKGSTFSFKLPWVDIHGDDV